MQFYKKDIGAGSTVRVSAAESELLMRSMTGITEYQAMKMLRETKGGQEQRKILINTSLRRLPMGASDYFLTKTHTRAGMRYVFTRRSDGGYVCTLTSVKAALILELTGMGF